MNSQSQADQQLRIALGGRSLVTLDRFTSAGRSCLTGPMPLEAARPAAAVGYYRSWPAVGHERVLAVEERSRRRDGHTKHRWLAELSDDIRRLCRSLPGTPAFAAWYADPALLELAVQVGASVLTVPSSVRCALEDKTRLDHLLRSAGVADRLRLPAMTCAEPVAYREVANQLGEQFVVQGSHSSGGRGTTFVSDEAGYARSLAGGGPWRVSSFVAGFSSNTTVLTVPTAEGCAVYVDLPSHKAVGISALGIAAAKGAGNDWSPAWPTELVTELVHGLVRLGEYLYAAYGLVGLWGADAIWTADRVFINEINVRNQGTTELSGANQLLRGLPPLLVAHLTIMAGGAVSWLPAAAEFNAESIQRAGRGGPGPFYLKIRNTSGYPIMTGPGGIGPGVYAYGDAGLTWLRSGAHPLDADLDRGELLLANAPQPGVMCLPNAELGTVEGLTSRPVFDGPSALSAVGASLHTAVQGQFVRCSIKGDRS